MTQQKISFAIEDAILIDENPNSSFSVLSLDFFASGANRHDTYVSEETLFRTANTIKNCPVVWKYDSMLDDAYTHDKDESPCGFIPEKAEIKSRKLADGRTMLSVISYVWKKFSGSILELFKRDGDKPISVEMSVFGTKDMDNGLLEILDYRFEAVTVLGSLVTPAIPGAMATVLSFSKDYEKEYEKEFSDKYSELDLSIPSSVKKTAAKALESKKGSSVALAMGRFLSSNEKISPERVRQLSKFFKNKNPKEMDNVILGLHGGKQGYSWIKELMDKIIMIDQKEMSYYSEENDLEDEPVNIGEMLLEQDLITNELITKEVENNMAEKVNKEEKEELEMAKPEDQESPENEKAESAEEEKKEKEDDKEKKFSYAEIFASEEDFANMFADEDDDDEDTKAKFASAKEEFGVGANPAVVMSAMYAKMNKMLKKMEKQNEDSKVYMAENEELKKFKADMESSQKEFAVTSTLRELSEKKVISEEAAAEIKAEAEKYSFAEIDGWKNFAKAKTFDFKDKKPKEKDKDDDVIRYGFPFVHKTVKSQDDIWAIN